MLYMYRSILIVLYTHFVIIFFPKFQAEFEHCRVGVV